MTGTPTPGPEADFAAVWPDVLRYSRTVAGRLARAYGLDPDDLFAAGTLAVWRACRGGLLAAAGEPAGLACLAARRAILTQARADRRHGRRQRTNVGPGPGEDDGPPGLEALAVAPPGPGPDGLPGLLALAPPAHRELFDRYYRRGETLEAIGRAAGVDKQTVANRLARALRVMRARLRPDNDPAARTGDRSPAADHRGLPGDG